MSRGVDLHMHTTASDGSFAPEALIQLAAEAGLEAVAVTDHDNTNALDRCLEAGAAYGVEVIPGIELSAGYQGQEVHILGYFIDPHADSLQDLLEIALTNRRTRNHAIAERLQALGMQVTMEELYRRHPGTVLGRPHMALLMVEKGYVDSVQEAFQRYLGKKGSCYVKKANLPIEEAFARILQAGGAPVLAHPYQYALPEEELRRLIETVREPGCVGMECEYARYDQTQRAALRALAEEYGLIVTSGSDFHGTPKPDIHLGDIRGDAAQVEQLRNSRK